MFDLIIGNPPYIQLQKNKGGLNQKYRKVKFKTFYGTGDIYCLFYEKGLELLRQNGLLCYITSNKWLRARYGEKLREYLSKESNPKVLMDLGPGVFKSVTVDTNIILVEKSKNKNNLIGVTVSGKQKFYEEVKQKRVNIKVSKDAWFIGNSKEQRLKEKIEKIGKPLKHWDVRIYRGVLTGLNKAFIISSEKREEILSNCKDEAERERTENIIKPVLRGRDIEKYCYKWVGLWVIGTFPALKLNIENYPALKKYFLDNFDIRQLEQSGKKYQNLGFNARKKTINKWFETQDQIAYYIEFEKEKLVWQIITQKPTFCLVEPNIYILDSMAFLIGENLNYIMSVCNSKLIYKYIKMIVHQYGVTGFCLSNQYVKLLRIPPITPANQSIVTEIEELANKIINLKNNGYDTSKLEKEIDYSLYKLYDLNNEEIELIEKTTENNK